MKTLDLCQFPLDSLSLIEASAGTGKTYAVANLYLRYLLEQKLGVDEILVVTFTEAATQELRDRVRARIQELSQVLNGEPSDDEVLNYLYQQSSDIEADKLRLRIAERQIDQSEIHTIHGFCQQLLARHALDLNVAFTQNLMEDTKPLLLRVCEDYWRQEVFALPQELL
ncbi:UvrD-helicase domain-containing protein, partial [Oleiphilus sp. HI0128]